MDNLEPSENHASLPGTTQDTIEHAKAIVKLESTDINAGITFLRSAMLDFTY